MKVRLTSDDGRRTERSNTDTGGPFEDEDIVTLADLLYGDADRPVRDREWFDGNDGGER